MHTVPAEVRAILRRSGPGTVRALLRKMSKSRLAMVMALGAVGCGEPTLARTWNGTFYGELSATPFAEEPVEVHGTTKIQLLGLSAPDHEYRFDVSVDREALVQGSAAPEDAETIASLVRESCSWSHEVGGIIGDDALHGSIDATVSDDGDLGELTLDGLVTIHGVSTDGSATCDITGLFRATSAYE